MKTFGYLSLLFSFIVLCILFYLYAIDANPPVEIMSPPIIAPAEVAPGDTVIATTHYCKNTNADSSLTAFWRRNGDGLVWELTQRIVNISTEKCGTLVLPLVIPDDMPEGEWQRVNIATYRVNPIASHTVEWSSNYIKVTGE